MMGRSAFVVATVVVLLGGCNRDGGTVRYGDLYTRDALVKVNGKALTKAELERDVKFRVALEAMRRPKMTVTQSKTLEHVLYCGAIDYFISKVAYLSLAKELGVKLSPEDLELARKRFLKSCPKSTGNWQKLIRTIGSQMAADLESELSFEALRLRVDKTLRERCTKPLEAAELEALHANRLAFNARQAATNELVFATASNVWRRIVSDAATNAFETIGKACAAANPHIHFDKEFGPYDIDYFQEAPQLQNLLPRMRIGEVMTPAEIDNGLAILRLTGKDLEEGFSTLPRKPRYAFSRIFFELPVLGVDCPKEELGRTISEERGVAEAKATVERRIASLKIVYPNGKVIFD